MARIDNKSEDKVLLDSLSFQTLKPTYGKNLNYLIRNMQRDKVSQFDKDNFTYACRQEFENFAEFVALHYSLSHRDDTEYWKANFNKTWSNNIIERK